MTRQARQLQTSRYHNRTREPAEASQKPEHAATSLKMFSRQEEAFKVDGAVVATDAEGDLGSTEDVKSGITLM